MSRIAWHPGPSEEDAAGGRDHLCQGLSVGHPGGRVEVVLVAAGGH